jgi:hypothetical protein
VETIQFEDLLPNTMYHNTFALGQFTRALQIAPLFQWYKAAKVTWTYEPLYNLFGQDAAALSKPYLYVQMNRSQEDGHATYPPNTSAPLTLGNLQGAGAQPVALAATRKVSYVPNWCSPGLCAVSTPSPGVVTGVHSQGLQKQFGWLATPDWSFLNYINSTPSLSNDVERINYSLTTNSITDNTNGVVYNGHLSYLDQEVHGSAKIARVTLTVVWEFKDAKCGQLVYTAATPPPAPEPLNKILSNSSSNAPPSQ